MGIVKETIKRQMEEQNFQYMHSTTATILRYYKEYNQADILYIDPVGGGKIYRGGVPISNSLGGVTNNGVQSNQKCSIVFINGNINAPLITGINSSTYDSKTCTDQGAYIIDESIRESSQVDLSSTTPMYSDWLDERNTWSGKYTELSTDYADINANNVVRSLLIDTSKFSDTEVGLTHLDTKATLKMKDNGDIDIFVTDNVGIRISKKMRKIYFYGFDININGEMDLLAILRKCRDCEFDGYHDDELQELKDFITQHIGYIEGDIEELKRCIAYTKEITGDIEYFSTLDSAIAKFELLKKNYNEGKYSDSPEDLEDVKGQILDYYEYFEEELLAARERWGLA